jgi:hypothetical protein
MQTYNIFICREDKKKLDKDYSWIKENPEIYKINILTVKQLYNIQKLFNKQTTTKIMDWIYY